jgi:hypothetical protein
MASQPLNTSISVFRRVRAYRQAHRHEAVAALTKKLRPLIMSVPGEEVLVAVLARDTSLADFSPYCGEARHDATRGFPIVVGLQPQKPFDHAQEGITGVDFAFTVGTDKFLQNAAGSLDRDLHSDLRDDTQVANA